MQEKINKGIEILLHWPLYQDNGLADLIKNFYSQIVEERGKDISKRYWPIFPLGAYIKNRNELPESLRKELGDDGLVDLLEYLFKNSEIFKQTDTILNFKDYKPFPSYLVTFADLLVMILPKGLRNRQLFDTFWDYQAKSCPGLDEQVAKKYIQPFIDEGITTKDEIKELLIRDWWRAQEASDDSPYFGPCWGLTYGYLPTVWGKTKIDLENEWRKKTGKEPKKIY